MSASGLGGALTPGARPAVLLIDLMRAYYQPDSPLCLPSQDSLASAARVLAAARSAAVPVIHTRVAYHRDGRDAGIFVRKVPALQAFYGDGELGELMPQVAPRADELVIVKQYASAFFGTSLASTLTAAQRDTVLLTGVTTSGCIRASAVDAMQFGFIPLVVADAVGDRADEPHQANLADLQAKYAEVVSAQGAIEYLRGLT